MTRVAWGKAKLEIFALRKEIISLLEKGNNLHEIFQILNDKNKLTANKSVFYRHATAIRKELLSSSSGLDHTVVASPSISPSLPVPLKKEPRTLSPYAPAVPNKNQASDSPPTTLKNWRELKHKNSEPPQSQNIKKAIKHNSDSSPEALNKIFGVEPHGEDKE